MRGDFDTFVKYNIIDSVLVRRLDSKKRFIDLARRICNYRPLPVREYLQVDPVYYPGPCLLRPAICGKRFLTDLNLSEEKRELLFESADKRLRTVPSFSRRYRGSTGTA